MFPMLLNKVLSRSLKPGRGRKGLLSPQSGTPSAPAQPIGPARKSINLALQGGGAHGAFTWGVLDQLLTDGRLAVDGMSGTSAGAVNAVVLASALAHGKPEEAREQLGAFWRAASFDSQIPELQRHVVERLFSFLPHAETPWGAFSRFWSPYDLNPLNINPLKELIERFADFDAIRASSHELFIAATHVNTGAPRVFTRAEITAEVVMASACLPLLFHAVTIDGESYWDGGYSANPPLLPFLRATATEDLLIVQINPRQRSGTPTAARNIKERVHEIAFNAPLLAELRGLECADALIEEGQLPRGIGDDEYRRLRLHRVVMENPAVDPGRTFNTDYDYLERLHKLGQRAMRRFLDAHFDDIGQQSTIDIEAQQASEVA